MSEKQDLEQGGLNNLFNSMILLSQSDTQKKRKPRPLPVIPTTAGESENPNQPPAKIVETSSYNTLLNVSNLTEIKRICLPDERMTDIKLFARNISEWKRVDTTDPKGRAENYYYNKELDVEIRGCCLNSSNVISCCALCEHQDWIWCGSEYDPSLSLFYANSDGCIPFNVLLHDPKFVIPWRYKNRKTGRISWKIIHMCGSQMEDAECETIVVNIFKDQKLSKIVNMVKNNVSVYNGTEKIEYLLRVVQHALGDYGLAGGASSSKADASLFAQMKAQGHNFMLLCSVKIGLCRHKALLFKILCDAVGQECALITGYSTGGRHQWCIINMMDPEKNNEIASYIIDPTSPHYTWARQGSNRMKAYKINQDSSFGHGGITLMKNTQWK